jgi:hypothetical protein
MKLRPAFVRKHQKEITEQLVDFLLPEDVKAMTSREIASKFLYRDTAAQPRASIRRNTRKVSRLVTLSMCFSKRTTCSRNDLMRRGGLHSHI